MKKRILPILLTLILAALLLPTIALADGETLYVAATGDDTNGDGTEASPYATIQKAVNEASEGDTIIVAAGEYNVFVERDNTELNAIVDAGLYTFAVEHNLLVWKGVTIEAADPDDMPVLNTNHPGNGNGSSQQTVLIVASDVTLRNLKINITNTEPNKAVEIADWNENDGKDVANVTIEGCEINGGDVSSVYVGGKTVGTYKIEGNILTGDVAIANGAGNAMTGDQKAYITNNIIEGSVLITGTRNTGWNLYSIDNLPVMTENKISGSEYEISGVTHNLIVLYSDKNTSNLPDEDAIQGFINGNDPDSGWTRVEFTNGSANDPINTYPYYTNCVGVLNDKISVKDPDGNVESYMYLQDAIDEAAENSTITLAPGTYSGNIQFGGKSLTIKAQYLAFDGENVADESKLSKFTGTFNTFGDDAADFKADQTVVIEGFAFSGDGLKVGNNNYNSVGNLEVRNCTMECGQNIDTGNTSTNTYGALNYFVKISGTAGAPYAKVTVENNYVYGTLAKNPINNVVYSITPIQLWDVQKVVVKNNKIDVTNAPDNQAINISIMAEDADIEVADNYIKGTTDGIFVTTWKLGGKTVNGEATFTGSVSIHDNIMYLVGDGTPIFIGYETEAATDTNAYGKLSIDATFANYENYNNGEIVLAEISQMPGAAELFYTVTYMDGRNEIGSVLVKADGNGTVELFTPSKPGYIFMGWKCSDGCTHQAGEVVEVTKDLTFTAIWANMPDITPGTPGGDDEPVVPDFPFTDVREGQWFYEAVKYVYSEGIMNGMDRYTFAPNGSLTRAMVWTMLARLDGVDTEGGATWYSKAQEWAVEAGVSDGTDPMGNITREQLVTMLWRLNGSETVTGSLTGFTDYDKVSDWAGNAMLWATVNGIIEGDEANALNPTAGCTRAQAAAMIMRFCAYHEADSFGTVV